MTPLNRRHDMLNLPHTFLETRDYIPVPTEYDDLCRRWVLRILIDLGAHASALHDGHVSEPQLLAFVGLKVNRRGAGYDRAKALAALRVLHGKDARRNVAWPSQSAAGTNIDWLRQQMGLAPLEAMILLVCVLARSNHALGQALEALGALSSLRLLSVLGTLLDVSPDDVSRALRPEGLLATAGLAKVDHNSHYTFQCKIDMLDGVAERLLMRHDHCFDIFADNFVEAAPPTLSLEQYPHLEPGLGYTRAYLLHCLKTKKKGVNILLYGAAGTGKTELVKALAHSLGATLFEVATSRSDGRRIEGTQRLGAYALSQRILGNRDNTVIVLDEAEDLDGAIADDEDDPPFLRRHRGSKGWFNKLLETTPLPAIFVSNRIRQIDSAHRRRFDIHMHVGVPPAPVRRTMLESQVRTLGVSAKWCERMAGHRALGPAMMARTAQVASGVLAERSDARAESILENLIDASLSALGEDPLGCASGCEVIEYDSALVSTSIDPNSLVQGLMQARTARLLFVGVPGSGKSLLARHIGRELGRPVMLVKASDVLSKYVGESEGAIRSAFQSARREGAVLVIDEADTFLGSRQSALRSWEVSMVNEFLQQMEAFEEGVFVATTNLMERLDEASLRRFDAKVVFSYLRPEQAATLLRRACGQLGLDASRADELVAGLDRLTPGDFSAVMRQSRFNPVRDAADLAARLQGELRLKPGVGRPIGFSVPVM